MKKCAVRIGGVVYQLVTPENEAYARQIASRADEMIKRVMQDNPQLNQAMSTVLALINAVDELAKAYQQMKSFEDQQLGLEHKASEARRELNRLREQNWEMKKDLLNLNELNRDLQTLVSKLTRPADRKDEADDSAGSAASQTHGRVGTEVLEEAPADGPAQLQPDEPVSGAAALAEGVSCGDTAAEPDDAAEMKDAAEAAVSPDEAGDLVDLAQLTEPAASNGQKPLDRMRQTNLDDYLRAFGQLEEKQDQGSR